MDTVWDGITKVLLQQTLLLWLVLPQVLRFQYWIIAEPVFILINGFNCRMLKLCENDPVPIVFKGSSVHCVNREMKHMSLFYLGFDVMILKHGAH